MADLAAYFKTEFAEHHDVARKSEAALANAPDPAPDAGFFKVPRVIG